MFAPQPFASRLPSTLHGLCLLSIDFHTTFILQDSGSEHNLCEVSFVQFFLVFVWQHNIVCRSKDIVALAINSLSHSRWFPEHNTSQSSLYVKSTIAMTNRIPVWNGSISLPVDHPLAFECCVVPVELQNFPSTVIIYPCIRFYSAIRNVINCKFCHFARTHTRARVCVFCVSVRGKQ